MVATVNYSTATFHYLVSGRAQLCVASDRYKAASDSRRVGEPRCAGGSSAGAAAATMADGDYDDYALEKPSGPPPPREYKESGALQCCLRFSGGLCWILTGLWLVAWFVHSLPASAISGLSGAPAFSQTLIWRSVAHHTAPWDNWRAATPPPPPSFT